MIPLADATALIFVSPIVVTILSPYFLGEKVGLISWLTTLVGFIGVLLIIQPGFETFNVGTLVALLSGILFGLYLSFSSPNVYRAQVLMVEAEQIGGSGSGGASGLINSILGNSGLSPMFGGFSSSTTSKIAVLESRKFTESFVEQYDLLPQLFPQKWDEDTDTWKESKPSLWDPYF